MLLILGPHLLDLKVALVAIVLAALVRAPIETLLDIARHNLFDHILVLIAIRLARLAKTVTVIPHNILDEVGTGVNRSLLARSSWHYAEEPVLVVF